MKRILPILFLMFALIDVRASTVISAFFTLTNSTVNGETFTLNGNTWTWTNDFSNPCTEMVTNSTIYSAATNMDTSLISCPQSSVNFSWNGSNQFTFTALPSAALSITLSSGWATNYYVTNNLTSATVVRVPPSAVGLYEKTNVENGLAGYLGGFEASTKVNTNAPMFSVWYTWISSVITSSANQIWQYDAANDNFWNMTNTEPVASQHNFILSGIDNVISVFTTFGFNQIFGGTNNLIGGGFASSDYDTILNGVVNANAGVYSTIFNGSNNIIFGASYGLILNGVWNVVGSGFYSSIINGKSNVVNGSFSTVSGANGYVQNDSVWMWSDNQPTRFSSANSNTFLVRALNGVAINTNNPNGYALAINGPVNSVGANAGIFINGLPVGTGGGGGGGGNWSISSNSLSTLYTVNYNPTVSASYVITNITISGITGGFSYFNAVYTNDPAWPNGPFSVSFNGNVYTIYGGYKSTANAQDEFAWLTPSSGSFWGVLSVVGSAETLYASNPSFNFLSPTFNSSWMLYGGFPSFTFVPSVNSGSGSSVSTVAWGLGDNWWFNIAGTNQFTLSMAQDWKAQNATFSESHKIFLYSATNCTISFSQGTNQWFWQNRQGLAASPPASIVSNETITINISHIGGNTNWLSTWETSAATNNANGGLNLTTTNWTAFSTGNSLFLTNVNYSCTNGPAICFGEMYNTSANQEVDINYTNGGVGYILPMFVAGTAGAGTPFSFPLNSGSGFFFHENTGNPNVIITNCYLWQLPH